MVISVAFSYYMFESRDDDTLSVAKVYAMAQEAGYKGTLDEFIKEFQGSDGANGNDGRGIKSAEINASGHLIITYTDSTQVDAGLVIQAQNYEVAAPTIGENGNWFVNGNDTGVKAGGSGTAWYTGDSVPDGIFGKDGDFFLLNSTLGVYNKKNGAWVYVGTMEDNAPANNETEMSVSAINRSLLSSVLIRCNNVQAGSGVIYQLDKSNGNAYIITNYHVVYSEDNGSLFPNSTIKVRLYGMDDAAYEINAALVGGSAKYDIAVLKITGSEILKSSNAMQAVFADSEKVLPLDKVVAIGNPKAEGIAASSGIVSVESEYITTIVAGQTNNNSTRVIRIDAGVNGGNSGGGLYNMSGEIVGIVNAKYVDPYGESEENIENIAYAIPSNIAKFVTDNIIYFCAETSKIRAKTFTVGIEYTVNSIGTEFDSETGRVVTYEEIKITYVSYGMHAYSAGLRENDVIKSIVVGGVEYEIKHAYQLSEIILNARPGGTVTFKVLRSEGEVALTMTVPSQSSFTDIY